MPSGLIVDIHARRIYTGSIRVENGRIAEIVEDDSVDRSRFILPGFVDAHIHIESSMLVPAEFARVAVTHGTVATVSDPHEIANVLGLDGVRYMLESAESVPFTFAFGAPSCVPATPFETAGATLDLAAVEELLDDDRIGYLSEMMNYPGVVNGNPEVMAKVEAALKRGMPVDGHAPGLRGDDLRRYHAAGISTDHESFTYEEGKEKLELGMKLLVREGSAARNFEELWPLIGEYPDMCMFSSDDRHPDDLVRRHIDDLVRRSVAKGLDTMTVLRTASLHPVEHYSLPVGLLREGDRADFIEVDDLVDFRVRRTVIAGDIVAEDGETRIPSGPIRIVNRCHARTVAPEELIVKANAKKDRGDESDSAVEIEVIEALDGQIVTGRTMVTVPVRDGMIVCDPEKDIAKIVVVNRYESAEPAAWFITGFGLRSGALASSVAHDSHNVVAVGTSDAAIARAATLVLEAGGGLSVVDEESGVEEVLPLPVAGLMTDTDAETTASAYEKVDRIVREQLGSRLGAPYMTLSFMALLVIPKLKLGDRGLFDVEKFTFVE